MVDQLFLAPAVTIAAAQEVLGVTHRWASQTIDKLCAAGVLQEVAPAGRARLFIAPDILRAIERLPETDASPAVAPPNDQTATGLV
jgi:hypothetical protein